MFDYVCIFTTGGVLLWSKSFYSDFKLDIINIFIKNILLEDKSSKKQYNYQDYALKWSVQNDLKLVFAVCYKEILQLAFVE